jgi:phosphatidate phosphatase PAH1
VQSIKEIFEQVIHDVSEHYRKLNQPVNLNAMNKEAVVVICKKIESLKHSQQGPQQQLFNQNPEQTYFKKQQQIPRLETIYRAEDLQKERQSEFQNELKKKEQEMSSILKLKKPEEINFTDDIYDKPIGNDMERLLAEALASRERELEQIKNVTLTTKDDEKRVSFENKVHIIDHVENNQNTTADDDNIDFIFNKLKKIKTRNDKEDEQKNKNEYEYEYSKNIAGDSIPIPSASPNLFKIAQDVEDIKRTLNEVMKKINKLCHEV